MGQLHFVTVAECKYVTEEKQLGVLSEENERKMYHLHIARAALNADGMTRNANDRVPQFKVPSCIL